ncbi:MAG: undecaprenyldiphospho-muramoylpentapeptide beta-N-acetylglucosaminyltransferase [Pseudomonadota bacterium]
MSLRLLIAGGGTGGHVFPALAVAEALRARKDGSQVLFVGTERGFEARAVPAAGFDIAFIRISGLKRVGLLGTVRTLLRLPLSLLSSWSILSRFQPQAVLGVGGYASGPVLLAAWLKRLPSAVAEQNSVPGFTNRVLGKLVRAVFGSFEHSARYFDARRFRVVGNPVRAALAEQAREERPAAATDTVRVLVLGGSQGARPLNEKLPQGFALAMQRGLKLEITHQAGEADAERARQVYAGQGVPATVHSFIDDMAAAYGAADLVVGRAGATTCAELTALGIPSILIPFPQAADDHQTLNARALADAGAAVVIPQHELDAESLSTALHALCGDGAGRLGQMREAARSLGRPEAAHQLVDALCALARGDKPW